MKTVRHLLILFAFFGIAGCEFRPFEPTLTPAPPEKTIQFQYEKVKPGDSNPFTAEGYNSDEALKVKITRPDGTEVEYSAYADAYGVLEGTVSVAADRPPGVYTVTITGQASGHETTGWFTVTKAQEGDCAIHFAIRTYEVRQGIRAIGTLTQCGTPLEDIEIEGENLDTGDKGSDETNEDGQVDIGGLAGDRVLEGHRIRIEFEVNGQTYILCFEATTDGTRDWPEIPCPPR